MTDVIYSDIPINFTIHPVKKDLTKLTNEDAITRSVKNLVLTMFYERPYHSRIGCGVHNMLFEQLTPTTQNTMKKLIRDTLLNYEPRIKLKEVIVNPDFDTGNIGIYIVFYIINKEDPVSLSMTLTRVR